MALIKLCTIDVVDNGNGPSPKEVTWLQIKARWEEIWGKIAISAIFLISPSFFRNLAKF